MTKLEYILVETIHIPGFVAKCQACKKKRAKWYRPTWGDLEGYCSLECRQKLIDDENKEGKA